MSDGTDLYAQVTGEEPIAATAEVSTETETAPVEETSLSEPQETTGVVSESIPDGTAPAPAETVAAQEPSPVTPTFDINDPQVQAVLHKAQAMDHLQQQAAEIRRVRESQEFSNELNELADGDPERLQKLHAVLARVATPLGQQSQQFFQRANASEKTLAALWIAAKAHLPEEQLNSLVAETEELMQIEGAELMQQKAHGKLESQKAHKAALSAKDEQIAELQRQLAARTELAARGNADAVDGGGGSIPHDGSLEDQLRAAPDMDTYWAIIERGGRAA